MIKISPPPPDSLSELQSVIHQFNNRVNPPYAQHALDKNISGVFEKLLALNGIHDEVSNIRRSIRLTVPFIVALKIYFNRSRPQEYADTMNVPVKFDSLRTAQTRSYPSGHATQAYYLAITLSQKYPHLRDKLFRLADAVSSSRMDRGVHYPSDLEGGYELAVLLAEIF